MYAVRACRGRPGRYLRIAFRVLALLGERTLQKLRGRIDGCMDGDTAPAAGGADAAVFYLSGVRRSIDREKETVPSSTSQQSRRPPVPPHIPRLRPAACRVAS